MLIYWGLSMGKFAKVRINRQNLLNKKIASSKHILVM